MKYYRSLLWLIVPLLTVALACNLPTGGEEATAIVEAPTAEATVTEAPPTDAPTVAPTDTPAPAPTDTPEAKPTDPPPTTAPEPTQPPPEVPALALETTPYSHPQGLFELFPPQGWVVEADYAHFMLLEFIATVDDHFFWLVFIQ